MANNYDPRFPGDCEGKRSLPYPYNLDLSGVLHHLNRRTARGRRRLANDPLTASFLCAGKRLIDQHLGAGHHCECAVHHDSHGLLSFLSQRNVVDALSGIDGRFPKPHRLDSNSLRDRWKQHKGFVLDLISFMFWEWNYRPGYRRFREAATRLLVHGEDFIQAVQQIAYRHTAEGTTLSSVRLSLALMAAAEGDPDIGAAISSAYRNYLDSWQGLYADVMRARDLRLRPGVTLDDLTNALSVTTDGCILRIIGDPSAASVLDHERQRSLMGLIALAILNAFLEPADAPDGPTLDQAVANRLIR